MKLVVMLIVGTGIAQAQPGQQPLDDLEKKTRPPAGAIAPRCTLVADLVTTVTPKSARIKVVVKNVDSSPQSLTLATTCGAPYTWIGAPEVTCPPSPCKASPGKKIKLKPRGSVTLGTETFLAKGDRCRAAMGNGSTVIRAVFDTDGPNICGGTTHVIRDHATGKLRKPDPGEGLVQP